MTPEPSPAAARRDVVADHHRERPLGALHTSSDRVLGPVSHGLSAGAENLLSKAIRALDAGDDVRARGLVERAMRLPFDEHEQVLPGWWEASMLLFSAVDDRLQSCDEHDTTWLDAAEDVLSRADPRAAVSLRQSLIAIANDYALPASQARRCRRAAGTLSPDARLTHMPDDHAERVEVVMALLALVLDYDRWPGCAEGVRGHSEDEPATDPSSTSTS